LETREDEMTSATIHNLEKYEIGYAKLQIYYFPSPIDNF